MNSCLLCEIEMNFVVKFTCPNILIKSSQRQLQQILNFSQLCYHQLVTGFVFWLSNIRKID